MDTVDDADGCCSSIGIASNRKAYAWDAVCPHWWSKLKPYQTTEDHNELCKLEN